MFTKYEKATMLVNELNNRFFVVIPFELKDSLKAAIPSVKFNALGFKEWSVSLRNVSLLNNWVMDNIDLIAKANLIKAKRDLTSGDLVLVDNAFCVKDELKHRFNSIFGECNELKGWFVRPEFLDKANDIRDQALLAIETAKQKPLTSDSFATKLLKLEKIIELFTVTKEETSAINCGFSATYSGDNADLKGLINQASKIIAGNVKLKANDATVNTFNDETILLMRQVSSRYSSYNGIETLVYHFLVKLLDNAQNRVTWVDNGFKSENEIVYLLAEYFGFKSKRI